MKTKQKLCTRLALVFALLLLMAWSFMGAGNSLAWFADKDEVQNSFYFGELDLEVYHLTEEGKWETIDNSTKIFNDRALYEPGYVQVVYLKIVNEGSIPFDYKTAVIVDNYTTATNVFGWKFNLQDYLSFGVFSADTLDEVKQALATRELAKEVAIEAFPLNSYDTAQRSLGVGRESYLALVVRMPEEVGNEANYRGDVVPTVELGLSVLAQQQKNDG